MEQFVAGALAGASATSICHPLDLWKVHLQVVSNSSTPFCEFFLGRKKHFSTFRAALYQGYCSNILASTASWGMYFAWYSGIKAQMKRMKATTTRENAQLNGMEYFVSASLAGLATCICTNPLWCIRTRIMLQDSRYTKVVVEYSGIRDAFTKIIRQEGIQGLYRGFIPACIAIAHGGIQFGIYESLKSTWKRGSGSGDERPLTTWEYLVASALSKCVASTATLPTQVLRSRLQKQSTTIGESGLKLGALVREIWRSQGVAGFFRGLLPNTLRVMPATLVTFAVYENVNSLLTVVVEEEKRMKSCGK